MADNTVFQTSNNPPTTAAYLDGPADLLQARIAATALRNRLRLNSEFSLANGLIATIAAGPVADFLAVDQVWVIRAVGVSLLAFSLMLFLVAGQRTRFMAKQAVQISAADIGWVIGTPLVIALGWVSTGGAILLGLIATAVLALALAQISALRRLRALDGAESGPSDALDEFPPVEVVRMQRSMAAGAEQLWPVMTDHELYAKLALNLRGAEGLTPNGPGFQRTCTDSAGRTWSETCTLWDPGRRFDIAVDTSDYPYPLRQMHGSWAVDPIADHAPARSTVTMSFAFQPTPGLRGRFFVPMMHVVFGAILRRIARGWERAATTVDRR